MKTIKEELLRWTCKTHATNSYLDRHMLREKALELSKIRGLNGFKCSERWLTSFLRDHGFSDDLADRTGPTFANYRDWIDLMRSTIIKYNHNNLFHVDELTMYTDILPSSISSERNTEQSSPRNRVTILMGCNSSGSVKLPLVICGSYPSGTTLKEHIYSNTANSYIEDELFRNWLTNVNERMFKRNRKILMFLRRSKARALKDFTPGNLKLIYLPENFPPLLRPLRKEVFHYIKMIFRRKYAERLKQGTEEWSLSDVLRSLIEAWETIPREIIVFSFQRTHFRADDSFLQIDCDGWDSSKMGISFKRFVTFDDNLSDTQEYYNPGNRFHGYNLRTQNKDVVQVNEDTGDPVTEDIEVLKEQSSSKFDPDGQSPSKSKDCTNQELSKTHRNARRSSSRKKSSKRAYSETIFKSRERNNKTAFVTRNSKVSSLRSIYGKALKREAESQRQSDIENRESLKAIVDKALTLTSLMNAKYTKKLIDSIRAFLQEITPQTNHTRSFAKRRKMKDDTDETFTNLKCSKKRNQPPSTSKDDMNSLAESAQSAVEENKGIIFKDMANLDAEKCNNDDQPSVSNFKRKEEKVSEQNSSIGEPSEKRLKVDHDWSKQFETTFVFGPQNANCSKGVRQDGNIVDSGIFNVKPSVSPKD